MNSRQQLLIICFSAATAFFAISITRPLVALYAASFGAGSVAVGLVVASHSFFPLLMAVPAGSLVDRFGERCLITWGSVGLAAASAIVGWGGGYISIITGECLAGLAHLAVVVAAQTYTGRIGSAENRETNFGWFTTFASAGQLFGPVIGGITADHWGYQAAFRLASLFSLAPLAIVMFMPKTRPRLENAGSGRSRSIFHNGAQLRHLIKKQGVQAGIVSSFGVLFAQGVRTAFFPLYMSGLGYSATIISMHTSARALASVVVRPFLPVIVKLAGARYIVLSGSILLSAAGIGTIPLFTGFWPLLLTSVMVGLGIGLCQPLSMIAVADAAGDHEKGLAMGLRLTGNRLAQVTNPLLFGFVTQAAGMGPAFVLAGFLLTGTALLLIRWRDAFAQAKQSKVMQV
ncbi:MAG TPA: MFS transporter [Firmicutes bacterium]|nr:MFS transporter [Bacillota bacterium]